MVHENFPSDNNCWFTLRRQILVQLAITFKLSKEIFVPTRAVNSIALMTQNEIHLTLKRGIWEIKNAQNQALKF